MHSDVFQDQDVSVKTDSSVVRGLSWRGIAAPDVRPWEAGRVQDKPGRGRRCEASSSLPVLNLHLSAYSEVIKLWSPNSGHTNSHKTDLET